MLNLWPIIWSSSDGVWNPILEGSLSDEMVEDLLNMQNALMYLRPSLGTQDGWEWKGQTFSLLTVYAKIRGDSLMSRKPFRHAELLGDRKPL